MLKRLLFGGCLALGPSIVKADSCAGLQSYVPAQSYCSDNYPAGTIYTTYTKPGTTLTSVIATAYVTSYSTAPPETTFVDPTTITVTIAPSSTSKAPNKRKRQLSTTSGTQSKLSSSKPIQSESIKTTTAAKPTVTKPTTAKTPTMKATTATAATTTSNKITAVSTTTKTTKSKSNKTTSTTSSKTKKATTQTSETATTSPKVKTKTKSKKTSSTVSESSTSSTASITSTTTSQIPTTSGVPITTTLVTVTTSQATSTTISSADQSAVFSSVLANGQDASVCSCLLPPSTHTYTVQQNGMVGITTTITRGIVEHSLTKVTPTVTVTITQAPPSS